jgi:hypothetical protein
MGRDVQMDRAPEGYSKLAEAMKQLESALSEFGKGA